MQTLNSNETCSNCVTQTEKVQPNLYSLTCTTSEVFWPLCNAVKSLMRLYIHINAWLSSKPIQAAQ